MLNETHTGLLLDKISNCLPNNALWEKKNKLNQTSCTAPSLGRHAASSSKESQKDHRGYLVKDKKGEEEIVVQLKDFGKTALN